jgi:phosphoserine phosphatase
MLVAFDFDGTLSDSEMTVLLAEEAGVAEAVARVTERAMNDEIDYATSLRERADLLDGLPADAVERAFGRVELRTGAAEVITDLRAAGHRVAILTGGFDRGVDAALERAGTDVHELIANSLPSAPQGALDGTVEGPLIDGTKDDALTELATREGIPLAETVAVGDGANDLPMLQVAGLAVGYDPAPAVEPACDVVVHSMEELGTLFEERGLL